MPSYVPGSVWLHPGADSHFPFMADLSLPILTTAAVRVNFLTCRSVLSLSNTFHPMVFGRKSTTLPLGLGPCGCL